MNKNINVKLEKNDTVFYIRILPDTYSSNNQFYSFHNNLIFSAIEKSLIIEKINSPNYFYFSTNKEIINKIYGIYNEEKDFFVFFYRTTGLINYISLRNISDYFNIKTKSLKFLMNYGMNIAINYSQIFGVDIDLKLSSYYAGMSFLGGTSIDSDYFYLDDVNKKLLIDTNNNNILNISIDFEFTDYKDTFNMEFYVFPPLSIYIDYGQKFFPCDICYYHYKTWDIDDCQEKYSFINEELNNKTKCYPNNQILENFVYNKTTNYFEKCYESCMFCSLMGELSSNDNHNCLSCSDGYIKSFEYIGNCYRLNEEDIIFDKIINNIEDINFTKVGSCLNTSKPLKINLTGEFVSKCPLSNIYKKYKYQKINFYSFFEEYENLTYEEYEEALPKYTFGNLCLDICPNYTYPDDINNRCICKNGGYQDNYTKEMVCNDKIDIIDSTYIGINNIISSTHIDRIDIINSTYIDIIDEINTTNMEGADYNCQTIDKRFYLHDKRECTKYGCLEGYYQFFFDCFIEECPINTTLVRNYYNVCVSNFDYCYIDHLFKAHCFLKPIVNYSFRLYNTKQYLKYCNESLIYSLNQEKTYLYQKICYASCPENTYKDDINEICECKYYKYYLDDNPINYNYLCFSRDEKCKQYIPVIDLKICLISINTCIERNYKIFNNECYSRECPINSETKSNNNYCLCQFYFYNNSNYLNCFSSDETCETKGYNFSNPNSKECFYSIDDCILKDHKYIYLNNCFKYGCPKGTIFNESSKSYKICFLERAPYLIVSTGKLVDFCPVTQLLDKSCIIINIFGDLLGYITNNIENIIYNNTLLENEEKIIIGNNITYEITTTKKNNKNYYNNISFIDFGECENILKEYYNIEYLLVLKFDIKLNDFTPFKVEYKIYNPITKEKLDLSLCNNKITVEIPLIIDNYYLALYNDFYEIGYDIFNKNEPFYYDICITFTTNVSTDIILSDRRKTYYNKDWNFCENGCKYESYDKENKLIKCSCPVKKDPIIKIDIPDFEFTKEDLLDFFNIKTYANLACLKCYKLLFSKNGFIKNYGNYLILLIIFIFIIIMFLFYSKYDQNISKLINGVIQRRNNKKINDYPKNYKDNLNIINMNDTSYLNKKENGKNKLKLKSNISLDSNEILKNFPKTMIAQKKINFLENRFTLDKKELSLKEMQNSNDLIAINNNCFNPNNSQGPFFINDLNDEELNTLNYEKALKIDNRSLLQYYWSLFKKKHIILFTFIPINDHNLVYIKMGLFLVSLSLYFNVSALFFNDETMHKIYQDKGIFNFIFQIPKIIYSTIISAVINFIIKKLALSEQNVLDLKNASHKKSQTEKNIIKTKKILKIKFNIFFIISFLLLSIFWYYLSVFCAVYKNTQITLIKDVVISFTTSLIYPFILNILPSILRKFSLMQEGNNNLYKLSKILAIF